MFTPMATVTAWEHQGKGFAQQTVKNVGISGGGAPTTRMERLAQGGMLLLPSSAGKCESARTWGYGALDPPKPQPDCPLRGEIPPR